MPCRNFVWILGRGSKYNDDECRYSIRSVLKCHPKATITIIGHKPDWYIGNHIPMGDPHSCRYVNVWHKMERACREYDKWIRMDDDFYLTEPFKPKLYRAGSLESHYNRNRGSGDWAKVLQASLKISRHRWCLHIPLPVVSDNFMREAEKYPERHEAPSLLPRQVYCPNESAFPVGVIKKDVKHRGTLRSIPDTPFFSIASNFGRNRKLFEQWYPDKCEFEQ